MNQILRVFFAPPYRGLPWLLWFYILACGLIVTQDGVMAGRLVGFDDQVRMVQVLNWINNPDGMLAGWYDRTIARANAPEGFTTGWTRLVDLPIAAIVLLAQQAVSQKTAALAAAFCMPLIEIAILFMAAPYFARPLVGKRKARLILPFILFSSLINLKYFSGSGFILGMVSHHPWYVIFALTMFGAAARIVLGSAARAPMLMLGASIALNVSIGIESYPLMACVAAMLALIAWLANRPALAWRGAAGFVLGALGAMILLPAHQPPETFFTVSFAEPSIMSAILAATAALFLAVEGAVLRRWGDRKVQTAILLGTVAAILCAGLVLAFPRILDGAGAGLSPNERKMAMMEHFEAMPVHRLARNWGEFIGFLTPLLLSLGAGLYALRHSYGRRRMLHVFYFGIAFFNAGMCEQFSRYYHHAMAAACAWLLWAWEAAKARLRRNRHYSLNVALAFFVLGPLFMLIVPALGLDSPIASQVLFFPAKIQGIPDACDSLDIADYIDAHYPPQTLLNVPHWQTAQFLYQSDVRIDFLANYPSQDKFIDNYFFFQTEDMDKARAVAARHGVDLIAVCRAPYMFNANYAPDMQSMQARLQAGFAPNWLKRVGADEIPPNYALYEVDKKALYEKEKPQ